MIGICHHAGNRIPTYRGKDRCRQPPRTLGLYSKYQERIFTTKMLARMGRVITDVCSDFGASLEEFNGEAYHVHLLVTYPPQVQLSRLVNSLKGVSARRIRRRVRTTVTQVPVGWTPMVALVLRRPAGGATPVVVKEYTLNQKAPEA